MKLNVIFLSGLTAMLLSCIGCASIGSHTPSQENKPYPGLRCEIQLLARPSQVTKPPIHPAVVVTLCLLDLPLSAALDTFLLPIDLTYRETPDRRRPKVPKKVE